MWQSCLIQSLLQFYIGGGDAGYRVAHVGLRDITGDHLQLTPVSMVTTRAKLSTLPSLRCQWQMDDSGLKGRDLVLKSAQKAARGPETCS